MSTQANSQSQNRAKPRRRYRLNRPRRPYVIAVRVSRQERTELERDSREAGISFGDWVRGKIWPPQS